MLNVPYLIIIPKFHKTPYGFREVTVGLNSYSVKTNKYLLSIANTVTHISKIEDCYIIKNSYMVLERLKEKGEIKGVKSLDFEQIFNNIELEDLFNIIIQAFDLYEVNRICSFEIFRNLINFIIYDNYLFNSANLYKQTTEMGSGASSALDDLYLRLYERKSRINVKHYDIFRYIDDILINEHLSKSGTLDFYPANLKLIENMPDSNENVNFLDISIRLINGEIQHTLYDKEKPFHSMFVW